MLMGEWERAMKLIDGFTGFGGATIFRISCSFLTNHITMDSSTA